MGAYSTDTPLSRPRLQQPSAQPSIDNRQALRQATLPSPETHTHPREAAVPPACTHYVHAANQPHCHVCVVFPARLLATWGLCQCKCTHTACLPHYLPLEQQPGLKRPWTAPLGPCCALRQPAEDAASCSRSVTSPANMQHVCLLLCKLALHAPRVLAAAAHTFTSSGCCTGRTNQISRWSSCQSLSTSVRWFCGVRAAAAVPLLPQLQAAVSSPYWQPRC